MSKRVMGTVPEAAVDVAVVGVVAVWLQFALIMQRRWRRHHRHRHRHRRHHHPLSSSSTTEPIDPSALMAEMMERGWVVVPGALSANLVASFRAQVRSELIDPSITYRSEQTASVGQP